MKKFGFRFSLYVSIFISACTICVAAFAADSKTDVAGKSLPATLSEDILSQFKNPDMTYRPGGRYDGVYARDKIAEQLVSNEVKITSESTMGNLEMASSSISTMRAVYEAANKYGISVMVKPNKNDNYSQGLHHATVENTTGLAKGDKIVGTNLMTGSLIKPALQMVLGVRYTLDGKGKKVQQEVVDLGTRDFIFSYVEGETYSSGRSGFPGGGSFLPQGGMPDGTGSAQGAPPGGQGGPPGGGGGMAEGKDIKGVFYQSWTATTMPQFEPKPPEPYSTFTETFSYCPAMPMDLAQEIYPDQLDTLKSLNMLAE